MERCSEVWRSLVGDAESNVGVKLRVVTSSALSGAQTKYLDVLVPLFLNLGVLGWIFLFL